MVNGVSPWLRTKPKSFWNPILFRLWPKTTFILRAEARLPGQREPSEQGYFSQKDLIPNIQNTSANILARFFPICRLPFSILEIWLCGIPFNSESSFWVMPSFNLDPDRQTPSSSSSLYSGNRSRRGTLNEAENVQRQYRWEGLCISPWITWL